MLPASLPTPTMVTMARVIETRVCGLKRRSALPWLVGET